MKRLLLASSIFVVPACIEYIDVGWNEQRTGSTTSSSGAAGGDAGIGGSSPCTPGASEACYSGPAEKAGVGPCKLGTRTCMTDGAGWGPCVGDVMPQAENCATPEDEDCDGKAPPCKGALLWAKRFGDADNQVGRSVVVDSAGNVLVAGFFWGSVDLGGGTLTSASAGGADIFIAKLDASGNHLWSRRFGGAANQEAESIAVDSAGNVLVTGYFEGSVDLGGGPLVNSGGTGAFVAKFDADGNHIWSKGFGDAAEGRAVAVDGDGNVLVTGYFYGSADFGGGPLTSLDVDVFAAKLSGNDGAYEWAKRFGDAGDQEAVSVAVDGAGNAVVTGSFQGSVDFGGGTLTSAGGDDIFVAKLDQSGNHLWSRRFGDPNGQRAFGVAVDGTGNVVVTGNFQGSVDFGGDAFASAGGKDVFVAKLDQSGDHLWSRRFGDAEDQVWSSFAVDSLGNVLVAGYFQGSMDFGGGQLPSAGGEDIFVAKLDTKLDHLWSRRFGDTNMQEGMSVATDALGNMFVTGQISGTVDFGGGVQLTSAGGSDIFVAAFGP